MILTIRICFFFFFTVFIPLNDVEVVPQSKWEQNIISWNILRGHAGLVFVKICQQDVLITFLKKLLKKQKGLVKSEKQGCFGTGRHPERIMTNVTLADVYWGITMRQFSGFIVISSFNPQKPPMHRETLLFPFYRWGRALEPSGWGLSAAARWSQDLEAGRLWGLCSV